MWSSPVMFGGGKHMANFGRSLFASATNNRSASQRAYQPASTACGSNAFGMSVWVTERASSICVWLDGAGEGSRLARRSRRGYGYVLDRAHGDPEFYRLSRWRSQLRDRHSVLENDRASGNG